MKGRETEHIPEEVLEALRRAAPDGRISCPQAREIARRLDVPARVVGAAADRLGVKIYGCELGCF
ncbi:MAG: hypothetical protein AB1776_06610 [Bacillota bacterium]